MSVYVFWWRWCLLSSLDCIEIVGQSLSIRSDLLSPAYIRGLASLQDQVPAFDSKLAQRIIEEEWGVDSIADVLVEKELPSRPVAAASLGQVYKVTLKGKDVDDNDQSSTNQQQQKQQQVAIKVQRPAITTQIALDMHLLREVAPILKRVFNLNSDTVGTVDAWGKGFVDELDYMQEAKNGKYFLEQIQKTPLRDVVLAPKVVDEYTSNICLVTEWIDGQRLDKSTKDDVTVLCSVCMNTYLR
jgi:predicted unusual protein kinase regulating ubiquinone biosynthesis (AarF/ABC1/UbiB family)